MKKFNLVVFILFFVFTMLYSGVVFATTENDVRQQITNTNNQIEKINDQIKKYEKQITKTSAEKNTLNKLIRNLNITRNKLLAEKKLTEKKISLVNLTINTLDKGINIQKKSINNSKESLSKMIYDIYINDSYSIVEKLLSNKNLNKISSEYNNILAINNQIKKHIEKVRIKKNNLLNSKNIKQKEQNKLNSLKTNLNLKQKAIEITKKNKNKILIETKNKEKNYKKLLASQKKKRGIFQKDLLNYEAQLQFILNPNILPKKGSEVLSFPLNYVLVTSPYGKRWGRFHYGIDFRASIGTSIKAMADGVVEGVGDTDVSCKGASYGKWVFIKYNNGLSSTYGHLSSILVKKGSIIKNGQTVALSGNTGYSFAPHLHISVYAGTGVKVKTIPSKSCNGKTFTQPIAALNAYLNPAFYLPEITKNMIK